MADLAVDKEHVLRPWLMFGVALGEWHHQHHIAHFAGVAGPKLLPAAHAVLTLPNSERLRVPAARHLARMVMDCATDDDFLQRLAVECGTGTSSAREMSWVNAWRLHERITKDLLNGLARPRWDRERGELWFLGEIIRHVDIAKAPNVVPVLDAFQAANWPESIDDPGFLSNTKTYGNEQKQYTLRSLNANLRQIHFGGAGTETGIGWSPVDD